jgi:hypothetical protein
VVVEQVNGGFYAGRKFWEIIFDTNRKGEIESIPELKISREAPEGLVWISFLVLWSSGNFRCKN